MKKIKISMIAVVAILLGIAVSAFTDKPTVKQKGHTVHFFKFNGMNNSDGEIQAIGNWQDLGTGTPTLTCNQGSGIVCYVDYDGDLAAFQSYVHTQTLATLQGDGVIDAYRP